MSVRPNPGITLAVHAPLEFLAGLDANRPIALGDFTRPRSYIANDTGRLYIDVGDGWFTVGSGLGVGAHNLLSATHLDTLVGAVARGSVIVGNSTPAWSALTIGAATTVFTSDGTDASWQPAAAGYTDEQAQDAVGTILTDSASIDFTYNDGANTITAVVLPAGVDHGSLGGLADNDHPQYLLTSAYVAGHAIHDEVAAALTQRGDMHFMGRGVFVQDNSSRTEVIIGAYYDAIVSPDDTNGVGKGNIYSTLAAAITAGHGSIFVHHADDVADISITPSDAVTRIVGHSTQHSLIPVNITCSKTFVSFEFLAFATSLVGVAKTLTFTGANCLALGCLFTGAGVSPTVTVNMGGGIAAGTTTFTYDGETGTFPSRGMAKILRTSNSDREWFVYTGKTATTLTGINRGIHYTPAQAFDDNDVITSVSSANLVFDAPNCQAVQCVWNAPSGLGACVWITENGDSGRLTSNQFLTPSNQSVIMAGQNDSASGPNDIAIIGNILSSHSGEDFVIHALPRDDVAVTTHNTQANWQVSGNQIIGSFEAGALLLRGNLWNVTGNTFDGGTRNTRLAQINNGAGITAAATDITYDTESGAGSFPSKGWMQIDNELIWYGNKTATSFRSCLRGAGNTTAATHADNAVITNRTQCAIAFTDSGQLSPSIISGNSISTCHTSIGTPGSDSTPGFLLILGNIFSVTTILYGQANNIYSGNLMRSLTLDFQNRAGQVWISGHCGAMTTTNIPSDLIFLAGSSTPVGMATPNSFPPGQVALGRIAGDLTQITVPMTNRTGANSVAAQVVSIQNVTNDYSFVNNAGAANTRVCGVVVQGSVADGSAALVAVSGVVTVTCTTAGAVARGDLLECSATAGQAQTAAVPVLGGIFAKALTAKAAVTAGSVVALLTL